jgi:hypothetical protein
MKLNHTFSLLIVTCLISCSMKNTSEIDVVVDVSKKIHTMRGGMGASWHALSKEIPLENGKYKYPIREIAPRGSAYGGNPPVSDTAAWNQIKDHAAWIGLNFIRVELDQRMYEPRHNGFDWENEEMQALYLILDWCEQNGADVFLQQMWGHVEWNAYPGVHPLLSAPYNLDYFANGIATLIEFLTKTKGYTCIKYFCMTNEPPGGPWGYWWDYGDEKGSIEDAWKRLNEEFNARGITVPISGPGWTSMPPFEEEKLTFSAYLGAIDIHSYDGVTPDGEANLRRWAEWTHAQGKPFFMTEYGNMSLGYGDDHPGQKSFEAALSNANDVIRALRAHVDGVNRWSFTNRGDLDGQWQLIQTFDRQAKTYLQTVLPENEAYYGFAIISRFLPKYGTTVELTTTSNDSLLMGVAMVSPAGELTTVLLNPSDSDHLIRFETLSFPEKPLYVYQVTKEVVNRPDFKLLPQESFSSNNKKRIKLPARSITTISSYALGASDKGIISE